MKKKITYILASLMLCQSAGMLLSCQDMLSPDSERHSYTVGQDTLYSYWGILRSLQNVAERYVVLGECRGELVNGTAYLSDTIQAILNFDMESATDGSCRYLQASDYYHVINSCNAYLEMYDSTLTTGTKQPYMEKEAAQVQAIRAWTYLQLVQVYGKVPFYTQALLTTDAINSFYNGGNCQMATADNLADLLVDELEAAADIELEYGYPQYDSYGYTSTVCHSSKAMIPLNLILGDLYLTKGDKESCAKAAQYYHNYLSGNQTMGQVAAGGTLPSGYYSYGYLVDGATQTTYEYSGTPWTETSAQSRTKESITAIPSSTNKLWGTVLRGVNELYGYDSEISVSTSQEDTTTTATISLTAQYDKKQLIASQAYYDLCAAQQFESYEGELSSSKVTKEMCTLTVDPNVGDARQAWIQDVRQTYSNGLTSTEKFITKQNPKGQFTTVYPMIYRKSQVWLRFAEAICNAGYPSYAFAILKDGMCNYSSWFPTPDTDDYAVSEWEYTAYDDSTGLPTDSIALSYENYPADNCSAVLNYIDAREATGAPAYLNFNYTTFVGHTTTASVLHRTDASTTSSMRSDNNTEDEYFTDGIHSRGCGSVLFADRQTRAYNYVDMVTQKAKENYGVTLTKADIYSGAYDDVVQKCVEDLIVDEEALELAFEGTRFFDLMRVARRRGDTSYLANKLGQRNSSLATKLLDESAWYFPLPTY